MRSLYPHRLPLALSGFSLALWLCASPFFAFLNQKLNEQIKREQAILTEITITLHDHRADADTVAQSKNNLTDTERDALLAPVNRMAVAQLLQQQAEAMDLESLTYNIAPEQNADEILPKLKRSQITLDAFAPDDAAVQQFFQNLSHRLPGRLRLQNLQIEKRAEVPVGTANLHISAKLEWFSNGSTEEEAQ